MKRRSPDDRAQVFTVEGVVAAIILLIALSYVMSSITFVSPQTEKMTHIKLNIRAQDTLNVMASEDRPALHTSSLKGWVSNWNGTEPGIDETVNGSESNISAMNRTISLLLPDNLLYNVNISYRNDTTGRPETRRLIYQGEPIENAGSATKIVVLSANDSTNKSFFWRCATMPKTTEVQIVMWPI